MFPAAPVSPIRAISSTNDCEAYISRPRYDTSPCGASNHTVRTGREGSLVDDVVLSEEFVEYPFDLFFATVEFTDIFS